MKFEVNEVYIVNHYMLCAVVIFKDIMHTNSDYDEI